MNTTAALPVVGVDLAKSVFQVAVADGSWGWYELQGRRPRDRARLSIELRTGERAPLVAKFDDGEQHAR